MTVAPRPATGDSASVDLESLDVVIALGVCWSCHE